MTFDPLLELLSDLSKKSNRYTDMYIQASSGHAMSFDDRKIEQCSSYGAGGVSVRLLSDEHTFLTHVPGTFFAAAGDCLRNAASRFELELTIPSFSAPLCEENLSFDAPSWDFVFDIDEEIRRLSPYVRNCAMSFRTSLKHMRVLRGDGHAVSELRAYCTFAAQVVAEKDGVIQTGYEIQAKAVSLADFLPEFSPLLLARTAAERALRMLDAPHCPAGTMPVVLAGEAGGTMVHEACGHGLEADIVQKDFSVYRDRIGEQVASASVTLVDDATIPGAFGSYAFDDEGNSGGRTVLIDQGVLRAYLTDTQSARRGNLPLSGNGRRESYKNLPVPRMSNTFLLPGSESPDDIIARADHGLFVKRLGGGEVDPTTGDYVFQVTEGYLIEKGRIGTPVRGAILTGNGPDTLNDIVAIGNDLHLEPGTCGKSGQGIPVTDGQPTVLLREIVVGGADAA